MVSHLRSEPPSTARLLGSTAAATTCGVLPGFLIGSQAVQLSRTLGLDLGEVGAAVAVAWLTASALSSTLGRYSERIGGGRGLQVAAVTSAVSMMWIALVARSWPTLAVGAALGGAGNALAQPSANVVIARGLPPERHGLGFGVKQAAIPMATVLGGLAVPTLTLTLGWEVTFGVGALLALLAALAVPRRAGVVEGVPSVGGVNEREGVTPPRAGPPSEALVAPVAPLEVTVVNERPEGATGVAPAGAAGVGVSSWDVVAPSGRPVPGDSSVPSGRRRSRSAVEVATRTARRRSLAVLGVGVACGAAAAGALSSFLVAGAVDAGMAEGRAGLLLMGGSSIGIAVRLVLGVRADRVGRDQLPLVCGLMVTGAVAVAAFAFVSVPAYILATPLAFGAGWAWPGLFNLSVVRRYPDAPGAATGTTQTGTYLGAGVGPLLFGVAVDAAGFDLAWAGTAVLLVAGALAVAVGSRRSRPLASASSAA